MTRDSDSDDDAEAAADFDEDAEGDGSEDGGAGDEGDADEDGAEEDRGILHDPDALLDHDDGDADEDDDEALAQALFGRAMARAQREQREQREAQAAAAGSDWEDSGEDSDGVDRAVRRRNDQLQGWCVRFACNRSASSPLHFLPAGLLALPPPVIGCDPAARCAAFRPSLWPLHIAPVTARPLAHRLAAAAAR